MDCKLQDNLPQLHMPARPLMPDQDLLQERNKSKMRHDSKLQKPKYV